jgi:protein-arginine kinase activator protein McsA
MDIEVAAQFQRYSGKRWFGGGNWSACQTTFRKPVLHCRVWGNCSACPTISMEASASWSGGGKLQCITNNIQESVTAWFGEGNCSATQTTFRKPVLHDRWGNCSACQTTFRKPVLHDRVGGNCSACPTIFSKPVFRDRVGGNSVHAQQYSIQEASVSWSGRRKFSACPTIFRKPVFRDRVGGNFVHAQQIFRKTVHEEGFSAFPLRIFRKPLLIYSGDRDGRALENKGLITRG